MVLRRAMVLMLLSLLVGAGCIKRAEPPRAPAPIPVAAVFLLDQEDEQAVLPAPDPLVQGARDALGDRNLIVETVPAERWASSFATRRSTRQRMQELLSLTQQDVVLLVEARAQFSSLMEGRYRWTVPAQLTLARRDGADFPVQATVEVPVFLRFAHQGAEDAVEAASAVLIKRLQRMADELLSAPAEPGAQRGPLRRVPEKADAIYFVMVDRHRNGDLGNDGVVDRTDPQAFHGGDLRGVIDDLDRIAGLGFRSVWLSPVWDTRDERIGPWGAFHGYWVEDPGAVEPRFGTEDELAELSAALRARGMGLILDFVANHVAPEAPLRSEHPDWFHHEGDILDWSDPVQVVTHDVHGLPDLAQEQPEVAQWLIGHALRWQSLVHPEGLRLDAVRHVSSGFWSELNGALRAVDPEVVLLGELFDGSPEAVAASWRAGDFGEMFDFPLHYALTDVLCGGAAPGRLASVLSQDPGYPDPRRLVTFLDNHDLPRLASRCEPAAERQALQLLLSLRGRPSVTWGTELGLDGAEEPANRADFDWSAPRPFEEELAEGLALRASWSALRAAEHRFVALDDSLLAWVQADAGTAALIALNRGREPRVLNLPSLQSTSMGWQTRSGAAVSGDVSLPPGELGIWLVRARTAGGFDAWLRRRPEAVQLTVRIRGAVGEGLALVGAGEALGRWTPADGVRATREGDEFVAHLTVARGTVLEYKLVGLDGAISWEPRANRYHLATDSTELLATWGA